MKEKCQWNQLGFPGYWSWFLNFLQKTAAGSWESPEGFIVAHNAIIYLFWVGAGTERVPFRQQGLPWKKGIEGFDGARASEDVDRKHRTEIRGADIKELLFVLLFPENRRCRVIFRPLFPPWEISRQDKSNADCCQNAPVLGANSSFLWNSFSSLTPCHSLLRCGQDPVPAAGNWNFSPVSSGSWICLPFPVPKNYPNNPPVRVPVWTLSSQSKQSHPNCHRRDPVFSFQRNFHGAASGSWKPRDAGCCDRCDSSPVVAPIK